MDGIRISDPNGGCQPTPLQELLLRCLAKNPEDRPSAEEVMLAMTPGAADSLEWPPPGFPLLRRCLHGGHAVGSILQIAPNASWAMVEVGGNQRQHIAKLVRCSHRAARAQEVSEIRSQSFVHPQQVTLHGLFVVRRSQIGRTAIFPIPRMHVFMRQQPGCQQSQFRIHKRALRAAAVV